MSLLAPEAFGEPDTIGYCWMAHYKGQLVHKDGITFRFWGGADNVLVVRVNGKIVLSGCNGWNGEETIDPWQSTSADSRKYYVGLRPAAVGDWITLEPGIPLEMELIFGEVPGGTFGMMLAVEEEGVEYPKGRRGNPLLPIFKTAEPSLDLIETIHADLYPDMVCVTNGPVFCDYDSSIHAVARKSEPIPPEVVVPESDELRTWTLADGETFDAGFVSVIGGRAIMKNERGKLRKVPVGQLSDSDLLFVELARPPKFNIDMSKKSSQRFFTESPFIPGFLPEHLDYVFTAKLKQSSAGAYNHELKVEFFAIGEEIDGDNYILFDRQESRFTPNRENERSHAFSGKVVPVREWTHDRNYQRGQKYGGYLVVVMDERGKIIDTGSSHKWLPGIVNELRRLPVGKHFDKTGARVEPPRPRYPF